MEPRITEFYGSLKNASTPTSTLASTLIKIIIYKKNKM